MQMAWVFVMPAGNLVVTVINTKSLQCCTSTDAPQSAAHMSGTCTLSSNHLALPFRGSSCCSPALVDIQKGTLKTKGLQVPNGEMDGEDGKRQKEACVDFVSTVSSVMNCT